MTIQETSKNLLDFSRVCYKQFSTAELQNLLVSPPDMKMCKKWNIGPEEWKPAIERALKGDFEFDGKESPNTLGNWGLLVVCLVASIVVYSFPHRYVSSRDPVLEKLRLPMSPSQEMLDAFLMSSYMFFSFYLIPALIAIVIGLFNWRKMPNYLIGALIITWPIALLLLYGHWRLISR